MEDVGFTDVSNIPTSRLDASRSTRDYTKWTNVHFSIHYLEEKGQRYVLSINLIQMFIGSLSEALAASAVKIAGRDVLATWKVLIALGVTPVLYTLYAILATVVATRAHVSVQWRISTPLLVFILLPFMNYAALKFGEAGMDVLK